MESLALTLYAHTPERSLKAIREDLEDNSGRGLHLLARSLAKSPDSKVVLVIDQFEELFTLTMEEHERQRFLDLLLTALTEPRGPVLMLLTLRADFYDRLMQYPELARAVKAHHHQVLPLSLKDLRAVIEQPADLPDVQVTFEGSLVGDLLFELHGQAGALPLLEFTLEQLFERRDGRQLTLAAYHELGGVRGSLAQQAEATYAALPSDEHRNLARALYLRLISPGATEQDTTRRRAGLAELALPDPEQTARMRAVAGALVEKRLLVTNEVAGATTIEVSHEALIREWKRLGDWLVVAREDLPLQQAISQDVVEWERRGHPKDRLYRGSQLQEARGWAQRNLPSGNEAQFLQASGRERTRARVSLLAVLLVFVLLAGGAAEIIYRLAQPPAKIITEFPVPTAHSAPLGIVVGPDGNLWFTEYQGNQIGRLTPAGQITEFLVPTARSGPETIVVGRDSNLWFTEETGSQIGRLTPGGSFSAEFPTPAALSGPADIVVGRDGNLWFTEWFGNKIGRLTPGGSFTEFPLPAARSYPADIVVGPDGNLWFTEYNGNQIGRFTPAQ